MPDRVSTIPFSKEFQKIVEILIAIRNTVDLQTDVVWTKFDSAQELIDDLTTDIEKLRLGDCETLSKVYLAFGPTSTYQELSISNGWGDEYLKLAEQFDYCHKKIKGA
jgi:hypothetical protein